ncbi:hypothetical protein, partial [Elstera litoralis]|uniref:hypothetical protein n=1 Tax=Elstera litoralis TaxID=552518 RepID=UPI0018DE0E46
KNRIIVEINPIINKNHPSRDRVRGTLIANNDGTEWFGHMGGLSGGINTVKSGDFDRRICETKKIEYTRFSGYKNHFYPIYCPTLSPKENLQMIRNYIYECKRLRDDNLNP